MSKRDEVARIIDPFVWSLHDEEPDNPRFAVDDSRSQADAILALLSDPDDRMVEAAFYCLPSMLTIDERMHCAKAAIRAAMKAAGE